METIPNPNACLGRGIQGSSKSHIREVEILFRGAFVLENDIPRIGQDLDTPSTRVTAINRSLRFIPRLAGMHCTFSTLLSLSCLFFLRKKSRPGGHLSRQNGTRSRESMLWPSIEALCCVLLTPSPSFIIAQTVERMSTRWSSVSSLTIRGKLFSIGYREGGRKLGSYAMTLLASEARLQVLLPLRSEAPPAALVSTFGRALTPVESRNLRLFPVGFNVLNT